VHVTGDSRTRREQEKKEEEEETSTIATVLFVDCHRTPFSGHCWLTKKRSLYIQSHDKKKEQTCQIWLQDKNKSHIKK